MLEAGTPAPRPSFHALTPTEFPRIENTGSPVSENFSSRQ